MRSDEGIQLHLFEMDQYGDNIDGDHIIFEPKTKTHIEFTSIPFHGNTDIKYCITEVGGYGGMKSSKWLVFKLQDKAPSEPEIFGSIPETVAYIETLTGKSVKFRGGG